MSHNIARFLHFSLEIEFNALRFVNYTIARLCSTYAVATLDIRELKQTDAAAKRRRISIQKDSRPSEFTRPLTSFTLKLNGDLNVTRLLSATASVCLSSLLVIIKQYQMKKI